MSVEKRKIRLVEAICKEEDVAKLAMLEQVLGIVQTAQKNVTEEDMGITSDDLIFGEDQLNTLKKYEGESSSNQVNESFPEEGINPFDELFDDE